MIEITNVNKRFGHHVALDQATIHVPEGECFGFIGPNGAGKSTTMKILAGLLVPESGTASIAGKSCLTEMDAIRPLIGYMPDFLGVYEDLTVDEYLQFFAAAFRIDRLRRRSVVDGVLELVDLTAKRDAMVDSLSRGMQQRLGVARVLLHEPKVLMLDEPASGLDPRARIELRELILELRRMGKTLMISSHILSELGEMSTSIGIIEKGKILFSGSVAEAFRRADIGERIAITIGGESAEHAHAECRRLAERMTDDPRISAARADGGILTVDLRPTEQHGKPTHHFLIKSLIDAGVQIEAFTPQVVKLEDAFLRLTKGVLN